MKQIVVTICIMLGFYMFFQTHGDNINSFIDQKVATYNAEHAPVFRDITIQEVEKKMRAGENFVVFADSMGCMYAKKYRPILTQYLREEGYIIDRVLLDGVTDWKPYYKILGEHGSGTPSVYVFRKGRRMMGTSGFDYKRTHENLRWFVKEHQFVFNQHKKTN